MRRILAGAAALAVAFAAVPGHAQEKLTVWWVKGFYKSEDDALYAAIKKYEAEDRRQGRAVAVRRAGHDPEDGRRARRRHRRRTSPMPTSTTSRSPASGRSTASSRTSPTCSTPMKDRFAPNTRRDHLPLQRQDQEEGLLRLPDQAADACTSSTGRTCWPRRASRNRDIPEHLEGLLVVLVRQGAAGIPQGDRQARLRHRLPDGRRFERLVLLVPDASWTPTTSSWSTTTASCWSTIRRCKQGPDRRADRLHRALHQGLHAAVVDDLEGPRQQRRLPQQDDRDDAQRDDLDRRQVARRREQRDAHRRAARRRRRRTTTS